MQEELLRRLTVQAASSLYNEGKKDKARNLLEKMDAGISDKLLPYNDVVYGASVETANLYYVLGNKEKAVEILKNTSDNYLQQMEWYLSMNDRNLRHSSSQFIECAKAFSYIFPLMEKYLDNASYLAIQSKWDSLCEEFDSRM